MCKRKDIFLSLEYNKLISIWKDEPNNEKIPGIKDKKIDSKSVI